MNIKSLFQRIQNTFKPQEELQDEVVLKFLHVLENARAEEMSCSDLYIRLDEFVEREKMRRRSPLSSANTWIYVPTVAKNMKLFLR